MRVRGKDKWNYFRPTAPTNLSASEGNAQAVLTWASASSISQIPIVDYLVQYSSDNGNSWTTFNDGVASSTGAVVTGLINGTSYKFRVVAVNGAGIGSYSSVSNSVTPNSGDELFGLVNLLLHMDGSGATFTDSSSYGRIIIANGTATQSSNQSRFGGKSMYCDGSSYVSTNVGALSDDFVIEAWFYATSWGSASPGNRFALLGTRTGSSGDNGFTLSFGDANSPFGAMFFHTDNTAIVNVSSASVSLNQWNHVAVSRSSGTVRLYLNGTNVGSGTFTGAFTENNLFVGKEPRNSAGGNSAFTGYIDDVRITVGSARGMTGSTIVVPTSAFLEASPGTDPLFSKNSLLLHMDGNSDSFIDSGPYNNTITAVNATQTSSNSKFGGKSGLFTNGKATLSSSSNFAFPNDFVIEGWFYFNSNNVGYQPLVTAYANTDATGWALITETNNTLNFYGSSGGSWQLVLSSSYVPPINQWIHLAIARDNGVVRMYANGTLVGSVNNTTSVVSGSTVAVGYYEYFPGGARSFNGYIDELRITKGSSRGYNNSTIAPPSAAFPDAIAGNDPFYSSVKLLIHADTTPIIDYSLSSQTINLAGSATISATQSKFGGSSLYIPASSYATCQSGIFDLEGGDWAIEFWIYTLSQSQNDRFFVFENSSGQSYGLIIDSGSLAWNTFGAPGPLSGSTFSNNAWHYIAASNAGGTRRVYVDGSLWGSTSSQLIPSGANRVNLGASIINYAYTNVNAYYDDIRITKGSNRGFIGSTITVPTSPFPNS